MARWAEVEQAAPELAGRARDFFEAGVHKTLATLRRDGSPRISGSEAYILDGDVWFGSMWNAMKALDLRRDPRFALHSASSDPPHWSGDAKVSGRAEEITDPAEHRRVFGLIGHEHEPGDAHLFRADIGELVVVGLNEARTKMVIESWSEGRGLKRVER
jgi:hypothetical protein